LHPLFNPRFWKKQALHWGCPKKEKNRSSGRTVKPDEAEFAATSRPKGEATHGLDLQGGGRKSSCNVYLLLERTGLLV